MAGQTISIYPITYIVVLPHARTQTAARIIDPIVHSITGRTRVAHQAREACVVAGQAKYVSGIVIKSNIAQTLSVAGVSGSVSGVAGKAEGGVHTCQAGVMAGLADRVASVTGQGGLVEPVHAVAHFGNQLKGPVVIELVAGGALVTVQAGLAAVVAEFAGSGEPIVEVAGIAGAGIRGVGEDVGRVPVVRDAAGCALGRD